MIRFEPDTLRDALLRPLAMAAPDSAVYVEISAPDFRFAFILALLALLVLASLKTQSIPRRSGPVGILLATVALAFVPWMATSGNGRYFIPYLLVAGPVCIALANLLPTTRNFRLAVVAGMLGIQGLAVYETNPWLAWGLIPWREAPAFGIEVPSDMREQPATYVTLSGISYSLVAPSFPASSRWIHLASLSGATESTPMGRRLHSVLASSQRIVLLAPSLPQHATGDGLPDTESVEAINLLLAEHRLQVSKKNDCRLLASTGLQASLPEALKAKPDFARKIGFWACTLNYPVDAPVRTSDGNTRQNDAVFSKVESLCPRFFPPGSAARRPIAGGEVQMYGESDMKVYVLDNGRVFYKYYRALNPVLVGTVQDILSGAARIDCTNIQGRSGLPWEREI